MQNQKITFVNKESILNAETKNFFLTFRKRKSTNLFEFIVKSKSQGGHLAKHTHVNFLDDDGNFIERREINEEIANYIIKFFDAKGDTHSFEIYDSDFKKDINQLRKIQINPNDILHKKTISEVTYTSTGDKLDAHWPIFSKYQDTGFGSIVRATMTLHQVCSSHCQYCSTIARNKKDSISLQEAKDFVNSLYFEQAEFNKKNFRNYNDEYKKIHGSDIRLRGLILSGGGQPNLWPHFSEFVEWLSDLDIDLGLITNGFPKNIDEEIYKKFKWIRVSITPEDASPHYINNQFNNQYLPNSIINNENITTGYSYVYGPWTDDDVLQRISSAIDKFGFDYCRVLTDCNLSRSAQLKAHDSLSKRLKKLNFIDKDGNPITKIFHQLKYHGDFDESQDIFSKGQCYLQIYNVFWDTTGHEENGYSFCYACDSITVLAEEKTDLNINASERKFNHEKWGTVNNLNIDQLFTHKVKPFFDPRKICSACLFMKNNQRVKDLSSQKNYVSMNYNKKIDHINFP